MLIGARRALMEKKRAAPGMDDSKISSAESSSSLKLLREVKKEIKMLLDEFGR
jgi:hypothetical protein